MSGMSKSATIGDETYQNDLYFDGEIEKLERRAHLLSRRQKVLSCLLPGELK